MTTILTRKTVMAAKVETTPGTAETITTAEAVFVAQNVVMTPNIQMIRQEYPGNFGMRKMTAGQRVATCTCRVELEWSGSGTPAWIPLLQGCGFRDTGGGIFENTTVPPGGGIAAQKTLTISVFRGNTIEKQIAGAMGNVTFNFPTGQPAYMDFSFAGVWQDVTDDALSTTILGTFQDEEVVRVGNGALTWGSDNMCTDNIVLSPNNVLQAKECITPEQGVEYFLITDWDPSAVLSPESDTVANVDYYGDWLAGRDDTLTIQLPAPGTALACNFVLAEAQIENIAEGDRGGISVENITLRGSYNINAGYFMQAVFVPAP